MASISIPGMMDCKRPVPKNCIEYGPATIAAVERDGIGISIGKYQIWFDPDEAKALAEIIRLTDFGKAAGKP